MSGSFGQVCAFCGATASNPNDRTESELEDMDAWELYDETILPVDETFWMEDTQLIGQNPCSELPNKTFRSMALDQGLGYFTVVPAEPIWGVPAEENGVFSTYFWTDDQRLFVPYHLACFSLMAQTLQPRHMDIELLFQALKSCFGGYGRRMSLDLNYGGIVESRIMSNAGRGTEVYASPPYSPEFDTYYHSLAQPYDSTADGGSLVGYGSHGGSDVFSRLAPELLLRIMECLDVPSTVCWKTASRAAAKVTLGNNFWKRAVPRDMPWIFDLPDFEGGDSKETIDWKAMYVALHHGSRFVEPPSETSPLPPQSIHPLDWPAGPPDLLSPRLSHSRNGLKLFNSLANRARIWAICSQITDVYLGIMESTEKQTSSTAEILDHVSATSMPRLIFPESAATASISVSLAEKLSDLDTAQPVLSCSWSDAGYLSSITARQSSRVREPFHGQDEVQIPENDWLAGFVVTTEGDLVSVFRPKTSNIVGIKILFAKQEPVQLGRCHGNQRLIYVSDDYFVVGLSLCISLDSGRLEGLALLEQPLEKAPAWTKDRLSGPISEEICSMPHLLWKDEFPPPELQPCPYEDSLRDRSDLDLYPMEALVFEDSEKKLSQIVALSADVHMRSFQVSYADGSWRSIGPSCHALKSLRIDGPGGERLVMMFTTYLDKEVCGLRFATNRGRQLVLGWPSRVEARSPPSNLEEEQPLMGICSFWKKYDSSRPFVLYPEKVYSLISSLDVAMLAPTRLDLDGLCWEPCPPPQPLGRSGPIYGTLSTDVLRVPSKMVVSWLDCRRPLRSISMAICNAVMTEWMPLCSLAFTYEDTGECMAVGPTEFPRRGDDFFYDPSWVGGRSRTGLDPGTNTKDEYNASSWNVYGSKLRSMRMWFTPRKKKLRAIQFVAENGQSSPKWGVVGKEGEEEVANEIVFSDEAGDVQAEGIVVYIMEMKRVSGPEEEIMLGGFQALRDEDRHIYRHIQVHG